MGLTQVRTEAAELTPGVMVTARLFVLAEEATIPQG